MKTKASAVLVAFLFQTSVFAEDLPLHSLEDLSQGIHPLTQEQENQAIAGITRGIAAGLSNVRDAHPKAHGCVADAILQVNSDLAAEYQSGVFAKPGQEYRSIVRFSSGSSNPAADDRAAGTTGMALKVLLPEELQNQVPDIPGESYFLAKEFYKTFDIITINGLTEFMVNDLTTYPLFMKASAMAGAATKKAIEEGKTPAEVGVIVGQIFLTEYISKLPPELMLTVGSLLHTAASLQSTNVLAETYNSWVPYAFDLQRAVKYSFKPCSDLQNSVPVASSPNFLGVQLHEDLEKLKAAGCFELVAQFHEEGMPSVENSSLPWGAPADRKFVSLAKLKLTDHFLPKETCEALSFNPAHALPSQRGIGATQRARRLIYAAIETKRNENRKQTQ